MAVPSDTVFECSDGEGAVALIDRQRPDIVLMDIKMAAMDGITATRAIKEKDPEAYVVIVTEYDDPKLRDEARRAGASEYVLKENLLELQNVRSRLK